MVEAQLMHTFKQKSNIDENIKFVDLLPRKVLHAIKRVAHQDKYKAALQMYHAFLKDKDMKSRGLSKKKMQDIAADHFRLSRGEFAKILNRKTRYEAAPPGMEDIVKKFKADGMDDDMAFALAWKIYNKKKNEAEYITEAYTIAYKGAEDLDGLGYTKDQVDDIAKLDTHLKKKFKNLEYHLIFDTNSKNKSTIKVSDKMKGLDYDALTKGKGAVAPSLNLGKQDDKGNWSGRSMLVKGSGTVTNKRTIALEMFGIKTNTDFLEFFQAIGLFMPKALTPDNFKDELDALEGKVSGDFSIRKFIPKWNEFVIYLDAEKEMGADVISLVNGSYYYRQGVGVTKPYIIWDDIKKYYALLKGKEGIEGTIKDNTADCVLVDGTYAQLEKALTSKGKDAIQISTDEKTGKLTCGDVSWYQISLKLGEGSAKLGKITKLITGTYPVDGDVQDNMARAGIKPEWFKEDLELNNEYEQLLQEGFFGNAAAKMKKIGGEVFNKFKDAVVAVLKYWKKLQGLMKKLGKKYEKSTLKELEKMTKRSKFLGEGYIVEDVLNEMSQNAMFKALKNDPKIRPKFIRLINSRYNTIAANKESKWVSVKFEKAKFDIDAEDTMNFIVGNIISFQLIQDIIEDVEKNGINVINKFVKTMSMGDTNLPVVKVYGNPSKADTEVITVGKLTQKNPMLGDKQIKVLKVAIVPAPSNLYWVINIWIFAELDGAVVKYHQVSFKKSGASSFNYNIEGTNTVPEDKIAHFSVS